MNYFKNGNFSMGGNFRVNKQEPIDDRMTVSKLADLQNPDLFNGFTYNGMVVSVTEDDESKNGVYRLKNKATLEWKLLGEGTGGTEIIVDPTKSTAKYVQWTSTIPVMSLVSGVTKMPLFTGEKIGNMVALSDTTFLLKKNAVYGIKFAITATYSAAGQYSYGLYNDTTNVLIAINYAETSTATTYHRVGQHFDKIITVAEDTIISIRPINPAGNISGSITNGANISIFEITSVDISLANFKINGKSFDSNNNIDLEGLSNLSFPKLNIEEKTEYRHSITNKPIWVKVLDFGALPNASTKVVPHNIANVEDISIDINESKVFTPGSQLGYPVIWTNTTAANQWNCWPDATNINMTTGVDRTTMKAYVVIRFTKTTETAESPTRLIAGKGADGKSAYQSAVDTGYSKSEVEWVQEMKGARGLPGPAGQDGTVAFENLTEAQLEMLLANRNIVTRKSINILKNNTTVNTAMLDISSKMSLPEKVEVTTTEDSLYTIENLKLANPLTILGDCKYTQIINDFEFDIFGDNSPLLVYPLYTNSNDLGGVYNGVDTGVTYAENKAIFNGAAKITPPAFTIPTEMTVSFNITFTELGSFMLFDFGGGKAVYLYQDNRIRAQYSNANNAHKSTTSPVVINKDYAVAAVIKAASVDIYLDGEAQINTAWANYVTSTALCIGAKSNNTMFSKMKMNNLRIFKRALSAEEIKHMYETRTIELLELYHGSGVNLKDAKLVQRTVSLNAPRYLNEAEATKHGLQPGDMYYLTDGSVKFVKGL